jgi:hypothetical protein
MNKISGIAASTGIDRSPCIYPGTTKLHHYKDCGCDVEAKLANLQNALEKSKCDYWPSSAVPG